MRGSAAPEFADLAEAFHAVTAAGTPAALVASRGGRRLLDLSSGVDAGGRPFTSATPVFLYSAVKPAAAAAALLAVAAGRLDLDAAVAASWPAFAAGGKGGVTVRQALAHGAAVPGWRKPVTLADLTDRVGAADALAAADPWWTPGEPGEHAVSYGHLVDAILRTATGRDVESWWADLRRASGAAVVLRPEDAPLPPAPLEDPDGRWRATWETAPGRMGDLLRNPAALLDAAAVNGPAGRALVAPAVTGYASARALDDLWSWWAGPRGASDLGTVLRDASLAPQVTGHDHVLDRPVCWGLGPQVDEGSIGMGGVGGCYGGIEGRLGLTVGLTTCRLGPADRFAVLDAALDALA